MENERSRTLSGSVAVCPIWPTQTVQKVERMVAQIDQANAILQKVASTAQNPAIKGGFAAETWHAESFNLDAILKDKDVVAFTDSFDRTPLTRNHTTHDIVVMKGDRQVLGTQLKYFKDADATQKAFRSTKDGVHRYQDSDLFLGPSDQIEGVRTSAHHDVLKNRDTRPHVSSAAEKVRDNSAAQIDVDGVKSRPLSKREAEDLGSGLKTVDNPHDRMQKTYLNEVAWRQSLRAAGSAAMITTVIAGSINVFQHVKQMNKGEITAQEAVLRILQNTVIAAGDSALKAGVATASAGIAARSLPGLFAGSAFSSSLATGGIAGAAICAVDLVECLVLFASGRMTRDELETRIGKNIFQTGAGVVGASIGGAIGSLAGPPGVLVGSIVGGLITSLAATIALDNHIETGFRLTLASTEQVVAGGLLMRDVLEYLQVSQQYYADFHRGLYLSEHHFASQVNTLLAQSARLKQKIENL
ncbi:Glycine zipper family protein [Rhodanobacter sp. Root179]|uniref:hypothetical protein n=1 Tax=Rhodanobacter sp. Root179 TaxID=1736482 RepID=UPI0006FCE91F|nr:hypothetical protein [Rhodanobacter sp. Root179]KRB37395.1 hypothetical protein ASD82_12150 [Rhodanobacter sp. Root179]